MLDTFSRPILFAHRGDLAHAPENTLPAFSQAIQKGADGIELDAKLTADGHVIVIHDETVDRTTNGKGRVATFTLEAIRRLDAGAWFDSQFTDTKVPLLDEVFETVGKNKIINIELTNYFTPRDNLVKKVCERIRRHDNARQIIFSSFLPVNLKIAQQTLPEIPRGLLALPGLMGLWTRSFGFMFGEYQALHPHISNTSREQIQRAHRVKRRVHVWTANSPEEIQRLRDWGVDGLFTDDPGMAVRALGRAK
ncbi:MAG: glycerophosphodiester phosphodiesterase [Chloroflexi bacterium]|nr:glycerophosphodiester phosphodiesterase [Chloroflexota bacterium]